MEKIMATIITYNPTTSILEKNISILEEQVDLILIVDNSTNPRSIESVKTLETDDNKIQVISNNGNIGIATALNTALNYARQQNFKWLLTFDQDSEPTKYFVETLLEGYKEHPENDRIAIIGPHHLLTNHDNYGNEVVNTAKNIKLHKILTTMTSGNLVNVDLLFKHGITYKDEYFIDYVDHEICLNIDKKGLLVMQCDQAVLLHNLGEISAHKFLGKTIRPTNHNAIRRYYITRNRLYLYKEYYNSHKKWVIKDAKDAIMETVMIALYEKEKGKKIKSIGLGIKDMFRNNIGEIRGK